jgi:hypothetical protein
LGIDKKYTPKVNLYQVKTGREFTVKVAKNKFFSDDDYDQMLYVGDVIKVLDVEEQEGWKKEDNKWVRNPAVIELHLNKCKVIRNSPQRNN